MTRGIDRSVGLRWRDRDESELPSIPPQRVVDRLWSEAPRRKGAGWRGRGRGRGGVVMLVVNQCEQRATTNGSWMWVHLGRALSHREPRFTRRQDARIMLRDPCQAAWSCVAGAAPPKSHWSGVNAVSITWVGVAHSFLSIPQTDVSFLARTNEDHDDNHECPRIENC